MGLSMSTPRTAVVAVLSVACILLASSLLPTTAGARNVTFHLYGSRAVGWGYTNVSLKIPGPLITVVQGDNVTLFLNSVDGRRHTWFIDYNNNSAVSAGEPVSPNFQNAEVTWNFTASRNGTFVYRSNVGSDTVTMWGNITILPPGSAPVADNTVLVAGGSVAAVVVVLAVAALVVRRKRMPPAPPPPPAP